jgi:hypothetical protein
MAKNKDQNGASALFALICLISGFAFFMFLLGHILKFIEGEELKDKHNLTAWSFWIWLSSYVIYQIMNNTTEEDKKVKKNKTT